jgi:hypothetical protein
MLNESDEREEDSSMANSRINSPNVRPVLPMALFKEFNFNSPVVACSFHPSKGRGKRVQHVESQNNILSGKFLYEDIEIGCNAQIDHASGCIQKTLISSAKEKGKDTILAIDNDNSNGNGSDGNMGGPPILLLASTSGEIKTVLLELESAMLPTDRSVSLVKPATPSRYIIDKEDGDLIHSLSYESSNEEDNIPRLSPPPLPVPSPTKNISKAGEKSSLTL